MNNAKRRADTELGNFSIEAVPFIEFNVIKRNKLSSDLITYVFFQDNERTYIDLPNENVTNYTEMKHR